MKEREFKYDDGEFREDFSPHYAIARLRLVIHLMMV
ncbi:hypothetical protein Xmau_03516 [Xenorhabdus mauleonii]|uniref:Uncharacterized protein n=1 Tax=Xenorhabdus mauleonii TaxID=351675 RepID=A0A1I3WUP2_9GAMM|nr:hypothetical protein Xmau_03516 [Xenorhabdus mauleonii]SFK10151.1 hypothetical protein SAMN05421680_1293 [Xenorhabdus mauleonii]